MIVDPSLTPSEVKAEIEIQKQLMNDNAQVGDKISSSGASVEYANRYNNAKNQLEQLYAMKASYIRRGEW